MISLRASSGLGDAIHLRAAVLHLLSCGESVGVFTKFPEVFSDLPVTIRPLEDGDTCDGLRHFNHKLSMEPSCVDAFTGACLRAGIEWPVPLRMNWTVQNHELLAQIRQLAAGRPIFVFQPVKHSSNWQQELLRPSREPYNAFIAKHQDYFRIKLGHPDYVEDRGEPCELDLMGKASIKDALDIGTIGDLFFGESCYVPMLGEAMDKRYAIMFTRRALNANDRIRNMTAERLFHKKHLATAVYDES